MTATTVRSSTTTGRTSLSPAPRRRRFHRYGRPSALVMRYIALLAVLCLTVGPILWQLASSLKSTSEAIYGPQATLLPKHPTLHAYATVFQQVPFAEYMRNSLIMCALTVSSQLIIPTMAGYMLSRRGWRGRKVFYTVLVVSMMFSFQSIMVSLFVMTSSMGLMDTFIGVWLPGAISAFNVLFTRAAFTAVPDELEDAALMDGAGEIRRFFQVYLPSIKGALLVVAINSFIGAWDDFLWPFMVLRSNNHLTLTLGLSQMSQSSLGYDPRIVMAGSIVAIVPILVLFIIFQRWFYKGVGQGAIK